MKFEDYQYDFKIDKIEEYAKTSHPLISVQYLKYLINELDFCSRDIDDGSSVERLKSGNNKINIPNTIGSLKILLKYYKEKASIIENTENINSTKQYIHWQGTEQQLLKLFTILTKKKLIELPPGKKEPYSLIAEHFRNKNNLPFKEKQLSVVAQEDETDKVKIIESIVTEAAQET